MLIIRMPSAILKICYNDTSCPLVPFSSVDHDASRAHVCVIAFCIKGLTFLYILQLPNVFYLRYFIFRGLHLYYLVLIEVSSVLMGIILYQSAVMIMWLLLAHSAYHIFLFLFSNIVLHCNCFSNFQVFF